MRFSLLLVLTLLAFSCRKKKYDDVKIIGHAGSGLVVTNAPYHDNSLESITYALETEGVSGVEIDIQCSESGTAWLFHDPQLGEATNGSGCINSSTDDYLSGLHYATTQKEALTRLKELDFPFDNQELFLDMRTYNECQAKNVDQQQTITAIANALNGVPSSQIIVITNRPEWIHNFYLMGWTVYFEVSEVGDYLTSSYKQETVGTCMRNSAVSAEDVQSVQSEGKKMMLFDARSPKGIRSVLKKHPDYFLADDIKATLIEKY